jgi:hypothetical protein
MSEQHGILAIWNGCAEGREAEFEEWYQHEHFHERIVVPGFLVGRRYEAVAGSPAYFCFYVTQSPQTLTSRPYLERLDHPTPMTRRMMTEVFRDMSRTVCRRTLQTGAMWGSAAITLRFPARPDGIEAALEALSRDKAVACAEFWSAVDRAAVPVSEEERLRGGDQKIGACALVETLRVEDAGRIAAVLTAQFPSATAGVYRLLCQIGAR